MDVSYSVKFDQDVPLMLRDGTMTYADVFRPDAPGKFPGLLQRTPYDKSASGSRYGALDAVRAASSGYGVVIQDVRGRFSSDGEFYAFVNEMEDGYDSVEWVATQPWCDGQVGMYGSSYVGATQWLAAKAAPSSLMSIAAGMTASNYHDGWTWRGGAFEMGFNMFWALSSLTVANWDNLSNRLFLPSRQLDLLVDAVDDIGRGYNFMPMKEFQELEGGLAPYYYDWLDHPEYDEYWRKISIEESHSDIRVPSFNYGGWYDPFLSGTLNNFTRMREFGATESARSGQRLVIGPWVHNLSPNGVAGGNAFGIRAGSMFEDIHGQILGYHDHWLKDESLSLVEEKPVRIFVMGENVWRSEDSWPIDRALETKYYLHSKGKANTLNGDGWLSLEKAGEEPPDVYTYNPMDPVPTSGGSLIGDPVLMSPGAYDQSLVETRHDVLVYTTPPLEKYIEVTGPVSVTMYAASSALDTDFTAKLVDVDQSGYARNVVDGIIRARYRKIGEAESLMESAEVYEFFIDLSSTSNLFKVGHCIRLEISSSNFPRFDRNMNTGRPVGSDRTFTAALQRIYHTSQYASCVTLPVIPRD